MILAGTIGLFYGKRGFQVTTRFLSDVQQPAGLSITMLLVVSGLDQRYHWSSVPTSISLASDAVVLLALLIVFRVFLENSFTAGTVQVAPDQPVIATGPYALVRHPMYTGSALGFLATLIALGSLLAFVPVTLLCILLIVRLLDEERYLSHHLPGYDEYCQKVTYRLIPRVW